MQQDLGGGRGDAAHALDALLAHRQRDDRVEKKLARYFFRSVQRRTVDPHGFVTGRHRDLGSDNTSIKRIVCGRQLHLDKRLWSDVHVLDRRRAEFVLSYDGRC